MKKKLTSLGVYILIISIAMTNALKASEQDPPATTCYSTYQGTLIGGHKIWHCVTKGYCEKVRAKKFHYWDPQECWYPPFT